MTSETAYCITDLSNIVAGVDAWEPSEILSAAEASGADKEATGIKRKLFGEEECYARLTASAEGHLREMESLLKKVKTGTATKEKMKRLSDLDDKVKRLKSDIAKSKSAISSYTEDLLKSMTTAKTYELMKTAKEKDIQSVISLVREAETVDLAFLLDCTGSMGSYIETAKSSIKEIVRRVKLTNQGLKLRVAVVAYRDLCDSKRFEILDFTSSVDDFEAFVTCLNACGGGDGPEDIAGAVQKARALSWHQVSRVIFMIADAPCHGTQYNQGGDSYPEGTPGICIESELKELMKKGGDTGIQLHFGRISSETDKMIRTFRNKGIDFQVCDLQDPRKLTSTVASSVRKSISKSVAASKSKSKAGVTGVEDEIKTVKYTICETRPSCDEWSSYKAIKVKVLCNKPIASIHDLEVPLHFGLVRWGKAECSKTDERKMLMYVAKNPFAEGGMRLAYYGKLGVEDSAMTDKILKSFKKTSKLSSNRKDYLAQMEVSTIARFLAEEYNKTCRPSHCREIRFLAVCIVESDDTSGDRYCAEDQLPCVATSFTKYSNNTGYWNEDEINQSLLLFTRFTHKKTGGYMMVTDLQGVRNGNEYILTDPVILCKDNTRFGSTNLGRMFIEKCMKATEAMLEEYGWDD